MADQIVWCDIPVVDVDRAIRFYSAILGQAVRKESFPGVTMGVLPHAGESESVSGCLVKMEEAQPSANGPLIYLNCTDRLDAAGAAVEPNGGKILKAKHSIGPYGFRTVILDSEGNRVALHSK